MDFFRCSRSCAPGRVGTLFLGSFEAANGAVASRVGAGGWGGMHGMLPDAGGAAPGLVTQALEHELTELTCLTFAVQCADACFLAGLAASLHAAAFMGPPCC